MIYQITNKTPFPLWVDATGNGQKLDNLKNIHPVPANDIITLELTPERVSQLLGEFKGRLDIKEYKDPTKQKVW